MKVIVFGATGSLGRNITEQALEAGYEVTAFARRPEALDFEHSRMRKLSGDIFDAGQVRQALKGQDAAIVAVGAGARGQVRSIGTANVIAGMKAEGVRRLIALSTLGAGDSRGQLNFFWRYIMFGLLLRRAMADHEQQEAWVRSSDLDWTIIRPAAFSDEPCESRFHHGSLEGVVDLALKVPRRDVARFMVKQVEDSSYLLAAPALSC
ncbi:MAG: NAD(P)H-binding protein [Pseudomonadales bacterium]|jgi:uncharacterized protein YbjT (DUF2867 family)|nr:NAD(P)H-binding protein [Pseudomonadales bacterium]